MVIVSVCGAIIRLGFVVRFAIATRMTWCDAQQMSPGSVFHENVDRPVTTHTGRSISSEADAQRSSSAPGSAILILFALCAPAHCLATLESLWLCIMMLKAILHHARWISIHRYSVIKENTSCQISYQIPRKLALSINRLQAIMKQQPNTIAKQRNVTIRISRVMLKAAPRVQWIVAIRHKRVRQLHASARPSNFVRMVAGFGVTQILFDNLRAAINWS